MTENIGRGKKPIVMCGLCYRAYIKKNHELLCHSEECEFFMEVYKIYLRKTGEQHIKGLPIKDLKGHFVVDI